MSFSNKISEKKENLFNFQVILAKIHKICPYFQEMPYHAKFQRLKIKDCIFLLTGEAGRL